MSKLYNYFVNSNEDNLIKAIKEYKKEEVKYILNNFDNLNINKKDAEGNNPLLLCITLSVLLPNSNKSVIKMVQLLINYANKHNVKMELNEKNKDGAYPLYFAITGNNPEIVQLLINYANQHHIILELNRIDQYGNYPLILAVNGDNAKIVKLLLNYANQHNIILELNEKNEDGSYPILLAA